MGVRKMREIKFRVWDNRHEIMMKLSEVNLYSTIDIISNVFKDSLNVMQYTGLKDKNGDGLTEVYEGDIISIDGTLKGNIYENEKEPTDIIIPQLGTKAWADAYKEAVDRGYNYSE